MAKATLITNLETSQRLILANLDGISHDESLVLPGQGGNSLNWIAGHILASRNSILKLSGGEVYLDQDQAAPYARGSKRLIAGNKCLTLEQLREGLSATAKQAVKLLRKLPDGALEQEIDIPNFPVKFDEPTLEAHLALLLYHEGYHTGQLGLGRCAIGKDSAIK